MAAPHFPWPADHPEPPKTDDRMTGAGHYVKGTVE